MAWLRYTGALGVVVLWSSVGAAMYRAHHRFFEEDPLSHLGVEPASLGVFRVGLTVGAVLLAAFAVFVWRWFSSSTSFLVVFLFGMASQVVVAWVPLDGAGASNTVHVASGLALGASLPVLMWRFATGLPPGDRRVAAYRLFWLDVGASLVGIALSVATLATLAEIVPAGAFHLWIGVVTLWSRRPVWVGAVRG